MGWTLRNVMGGALALCCAISAAQAKASIDNWISIWATAQDLTPAPILAVPPPPPEVLAQFKTMPQRVVPIPGFIENQTVRMILQPTLAGDTVRIQLSNAVGKPPLTVNAAHVALRAVGGGIDPSSDRALTFGGKPISFIPPGAMIVSDPVRLQVRPDRELAVSLYIKGNSGGVTAHPLGLNPAYIAAGDQTAAPTLTGAREVRSYFWLSGVEAAVTQPSSLIVAFGDSITDGFATTPGRHNSWPEILAQRLRARGGSPQWSVINMGISGNRVLRDGAGASGLARFDRDVLSRPGAKWMIILEGVNDINMSQMKGLPDDQKTDADGIIAGLSAMVAKAHLHGIKVMGGTITATEGLWLYTPQSEATRQAVNSWIRQSGTFDAVVDFDGATRDPSRPGRLRPEFDSGDHVHPNDAGTRAMAEAIDLSVFER
jgi:lysophospholipase L1-like esterase